MKNQGGSKKSSQGRKSEPRAQEQGRAQTRKNQSQSSSRSAQKRNAGSDERNI